MKRNSKELTARLIELRNAIKRKYRAFKEGAVESDIMLERQYKPIIEELRKTNTTPEVKTEPETFKEEFKEESMDYSEGEEESFTPVTESTPKRHDSVVSVVATPEGRETASKYVKMYFKNSLTQKYMQSLLKDVGKSIDHDYGPRYENDTLMVGDSPLQFDDDGTIVINSVKYNPTEGLYELLFKRVPDEDIYTEDDLKTYKHILHATNAHRDKYRPDGRVKRTSGLKYRRVIKDLFPVSGKGMTWKNTKSKDIVHWDNPNELVERLKHIAMSTETGNSVHTNEIISIVEELREAGYIKGRGSSKFAALLK